MFDEDKLKCMMGWEWVGRCRDDEWRKEWMNMINTTIIWNQVSRERREWRKCQKTGIEKLQRVRIATIRISLNWHWWITSSGEAEACFLCSILLGNYSQTERAKILNSRFPAQRLAQTEPSVLELRYLGLSAIFFFLIEILELSLLLEHWEKIPYPSNKVAVTRIAYFYGNYLVEWWP